MRSHLVLTCVIFLFSGLGLGYRYLWQDEIETAERARSILQTGFPKVIIGVGDLSLNALGRELEEGDLHRYSPWGQFYVGALGLGVGKWFELTPDKSLRIPFVLAHAGTSGLISYGLASVAGAPVSLALAAGSLYGIQTHRLMHNRTARYHALLDFFAALGLVALGFISKKRKWAWPLFACCIFFPPHIHTLGGSLLSALLAIMSLCLLCEAPPSPGLSVRNWLRFCFLPGVLSLVLLVLLTRPWAQSAWGGGLSGDHLFRSIGNKSMIRYALDFTLIWALIFFIIKRNRLALSLLALVLFAYGLTGLLDYHPFSQSRYYLFLPVLFLFWPIAFIPFTATQKRPQMIFGMSLLAFILGPDLTTRQFEAFQGTRVVWSDYEHAQAGALQPLHEALDEIRKIKKPVLIDYVPQYANWYLPGWPLALMPDATQKNPLNAKNPVWDQPLQMPSWHLWYPSWGAGGWTCMDQCDYFVSEMDPIKKEYILTSKRAGISKRMCVVREWRTSQWNNSPFEMVLQDSLNPEGLKSQTLALAKQCDG